MEICYGVGYDWRNASIDGVTVHAVGGEKAHGRWDHYYFRSLFWYFIQMHFTSFELWRYMMFNGLIDSTQVQPQRGSSSRSSVGSTCRRRMEQDIANEKMEQQLRKNEEYNLHVQDYYRKWEEHRDPTFAQQQEALQVSMIVNNQLPENWTFNLYY
jgi:hypothetical protein